MRKRSRLYGPVLLAVLTIVLTGCIRLWAPGESEPAESGVTSEADAGDHTGAGGAEPDPGRPEVGEVPGADDWVAYTSPMRGVYVALPRGWKPCASGFGYVDVATAEPCAAADAVARIAVQRIDETGGLDGFWQTLKAQISGEHPEAVFGEPERAVLSDSEGYQVAFSYEEEGEPVRGVLYLMVRGDRGVSVMGRAPAAQFEGHALAFAQMAAGLDVRQTQEK